MNKLDLKPEKKKKRKKKKKFLYFILIIKNIFIAYIKLKIYYTK